MSGAVQSESEAAHSILALALSSCARDWIRTSTSFRTPPPEDGASTNFATRAYRKNIRVANVKSKIKSKKSKTRFPQKLIREFIADNPGARPFIILHS
jgi:hypothetical protein